MQSGGSELEALHEAYRQIHVVANLDEHHHHYSSVEDRVRINRPETLSPPPQHARQSLQPASTNESGQYCGLPGQFTGSFTKAASQVGLLSVRCFKFLFKK